MTLAQLKRRLDKLSPAGIRFVARMVDSLSTPPRAEVNEQATWLTPEWIEYFGLSLSVHHGMTTEPLAQKSFETVFRNACESVGWKTIGPESQTVRFLDLRVKREGAAEQKLSLKSTAAQRLSRSTVHISKLTEAAWIQDMRTARERRERTVSLFRDYMNAVDSIMMLRAFRAGQGIPTEYQLLEIPSAIFGSLLDAPASEFGADGPTIDCAFAGLNAAARVSLDRSDAKITVKQIQIAACTVHVVWEIAPS
ncbi:MAG: hypothetical protein OXQ86_07380 [Gammaproteobacteria bacterium]|nr:hypothetical protein [Gammaproteobacteria bacterium]MDE0413390.1 hypothetical protein [Gammaproteobacteria bacterium]